MRLREGYARTSEKDKKGNKWKRVISDDAFAVCDFIERLINKLEHARISMMR